MTTTTFNQAGVQDVSEGALKPLCERCEPISPSVALSPLDTLAGREPRALCARHHLAELFELLEIADQQREGAWYDR